MTGYNKDTQCFLEDVLFDLDSLTGSYKEVYSYIDIVIPKTTTLKFRVILDNYTYKDTLFYNVVINEDLKTFTFDVEYIDRIVEAI